MLEGYAIFVEIGQQKMQVMIQTFQSVDPLATSC